MKGDGVSGEVLVCPQGHTGEGFRLVRDGFVSTKAGPRQLYRCIDVDGQAHRFRATPSPLTARRAPVRCPQPGHKDATVRSRGTRSTNSGKWRRFECVRPDGSKHSFQFMLSASAVTVAPASPPPACPEHPGSKVTRNGTYGVHNLRQRYLCVPADDRRHQFTPPLSREVVTLGEECARCDELLSPHHGPVTAARATTWTLVGVAQALRTSTGASRTRMRRWS